MLASNRKRQLPLLAGLAFTLFFVYIYRDTEHIYLSWPSSSRLHAQHPPANRTLGFGAVVVVSKEDSKRRHALLQAANITGLDFVIPQQPDWTENQIEKFRNGQVDDVQHGSLLAWMGHYNALQWFLNSGLDTALILEDDVDWDIRLRSIQVPRAASAVRTMMPPRRPLRFIPRLEQDLSSYWGDYSTWDLLYLGHCGDYFHTVSYQGLASGKLYTLNDVEHVIYNDPTLPPRSQLHPFTQELFSKLAMPEQTRAFHRSKFPLCSFGYAINRPAAKLLQSNLAPLKLKPKGPRAFDVALLHACARGSQETTRTSAAQLANTPSDPHRGLRCWTLNSELFHHMPGESEIANIGKTMGEGSGQGLPPVDWAGQAQAVLRNETTNIECGFWSGDFAFEEGDEGRLRVLREEVGRKGRCLKDGRAAA